MTSVPIDRLSGKESVFVGATPRLSLLTKENVFVAATSLNTTIHHETIENPAAHFIASLCLMDAKLGRSRTCYYRDTILEETQQSDQDWWRYNFSSGGWAKSTFYAAVRDPMVEWMRL
jgi:hypothetical protein